MKKTLIFIILQMFCAPKEVVATIQKTILLKKELSSLSFKPQRFLFLATKTDTSKQKCVQIHLKDSTILYGKVSSMDETHLFIQSCDSKNALITSIPITTLSQVTDTQGKIIFHNEPKPKKTLGKTEARGVFLANFSLGAIITSAISLILLGILPASATIASRGFFLAKLTTLGNLLAFGFLGGLAFGFIIGAIASMMLKRVNNKSAKTKALIGTAPVLLLLLLFLFISIFGN